MSRRIIGITILATAAQLASAATIYDVTFRTSALQAHAAAPFSLNVQLNDGEGVGNANNTATLSDFDFGGGSPSGSALLVGGASGDFTGSVSISDTAFLNSFTQQFVAGIVLRFRLNLTTNLNSGPVPDQFSVAILDNTGFEIPTQGLAATGSDVFLLVDIGSDTSAVQTFASDAGRHPFGGGGPIDMPEAVLAAPVPEPGSLPLVFAALAAVVLRARRQIHETPR